MLGKCFSSTYRTSTVHLLEVLAQFISNTTEFENLNSNVNLRCFIKFVAWQEPMVIF